jgi:hypothetical protein
MDGKKKHTDKSSSSDKSSDTSSEKSSSERDYKTYLNKYFEIKNTYDETQKKIKSKGKKAVPIQCLQCGQRGGTLFSNKNNRYSALCGAEQSCGLHLELYRGFFLNSTNVLYDYMNVLELSKEIIIILQNNDVYHYAKDELKKKYETEKTHYETVTNLFMDLQKCLYDNAEIKEKTKEKINSINKAVVDIRSTVEDFKKSKNTEFIQNAIENQINVLLPLLEELRHLKYEIVEEDIKEIKKTNKYMKAGEMVVEKRFVSQSILVEREVALDKEEINLKEPPAVIKWVMKKGH